MKIIKATKEHLPQLGTLIYEAQTELYKHPDYTIKPTPDTINLVLEVARAYISGRAKGVVLLDKNLNSYFICGALGQQAETDLGNVCQDSGAYVRSFARRQGVLKALMAENIKQMKALGFDTLVSEAHSHIERYEAMLARLGYKTLVRVDYLNLDDARPEDM